MLRNKRFKGNYADVRITAEELGIENFSSSVVSPAAISIAFLTVPAGCKTLSLRPVQTTAGSFTKLGNAVGIEVNGTAVVTSSYVLQPEDVELRIGVNEGDTIAFIGDSGSPTGQILASYLG